MEIVKAGTEKRTGLPESLYATLHKQIGQHPVDAHFGGEPLDLGPVGRLPDDPLAVLSHISTKLIIYFGIFIVLLQYGI